MTPEETIKDLQRQLEEERSYSKMLEMERDSMIDRKVEAVERQAELRGYQNGIQAGTSGWTSESAERFASALQAELRSRIPELVREAVPEEYKHLLDPKAYAKYVDLRVHVNTFQETYETETYMTVSIPPVCFNVGTVMRSPIY